MRNRRVVKASCRRAYRLVLKRGKITLKFKRCSARVYRRYVRAFSFKIRRFRGRRVRAIRVVRRIVYARVGAPIASRCVPVLRKIARASLPSRRVIIYRALYQGRVTAALKIAVKAWTKRVYNV